MVPTKGQYSDILNTLGFVDKNDCEIRYEDGKDKENTFDGVFIVKIEDKGMFFYYKSKMLVCDID